MRWRGSLGGSRGGGARRLTTHAVRALQNAWLSRGRRLFGPGFALDYLRFAWRARRMDSTGPGSLSIAGSRIEYLNQSHALFLLHEIFVNAEYEFSAETERPRIIDCGANIGMAVLFFKALYPGAEVLAFEPDAAAFAVLTRTIAANQLRGVSAEQAAVTEAGGMAALYRNPDDRGSIAASIDAMWGGGTSEEVLAVRLSDRINAPVDFLKLDIEGAEYGVVRDLVRTGAIRWVREAVIEYHHLAGDPHALDEMMSALAASDFALESTPAGGALPVGLIHARRLSRRG